MGQKAQSHEEHERTKVYQGVDDDRLTGRFSRKAKTNVQKSMQDKADEVEEQREVHEDKLEVEVEDDQNA